MAEFAEVDMEVRQGLPSKNWIDLSKRNATGCGLRLQMDNCYFRISADTQRRSPSSNTIRSVELKRANPAEAMNELAIDSGSKPSVREKLSTMGVSGNLQGNTGFFRDWRAIRGVA